MTDDRYVRGYGTRSYPFAKREMFTYADLMMPHEPYQNPTQNPTMHDVDALDVRNPIPVDPDDD